jgi:hypothetical protein
MISDDIEGHLSFARVGIFPYTLRPILLASPCIWITQSDSIVLLDYNFFWWNKSAPPNASQLCTKLGFACETLGHWCLLALDKLQPWKLNLATLGCYLRLFCLCALPNLSPVACCLAFPSSSPPKTWLAHFFKNIFTHCCLIHSALWIFSKGS